MSGPAEFRVNVAAPDRPVTGSDSCILVVPDDVYVRTTPDAEPALNVRAVHAVLRQVGDDAAARLGEQLHHAEWVITSDPELVEKLGIHSPGCLTCRAGVDQALAHLAAGGGPLLVGTLYWAG